MPDTSPAYSGIFKWSMNLSNTPAALYNDTVLRQFSIMAVIWGLVGMIVGAAIASQLVWPELP